MLISYLTFSLVIIYFQNNDSWGGSSGRADGDVTVYQLFGEDKTRCRRLDLTCNGTKLCEFFDRDLLKGYVRYKANDDDMRNIFMSELEANEQEFRAPDAIMAR